MGATFKMQIHVLILFRSVWAKTHLRWHDIIVIVLCNIHIYQAHINTIVLINHHSHLATSDRPLEDVQYLRLLEDNLSENWFQHSPWPSPTYLQCFLYQLTWHILQLFDHQIWWICDQGNCKGIINWSVLYYWYKCRNECMWGLIADTRGTKHHKSIL